MFFKRAGGNAWDARGNGPSWRIIVELDYLWQVCGTVKGLERNSLSSLRSLRDERLEIEKSFHLGAGQLSRGKASSPFHALSVFAGMYKSATAQSLG